MDKFFKNSFKKTRELIKQENEQTRNLLKELIATVKDASSQTRISQLKTSAMIVNKLDTCHYDSMKLVKERLSQMNRSNGRYNWCWNVDREDMELDVKSRNDLFGRCHRIKRTGITL